MSPKSIDKDVERLLKVLKATHEPVFLDVTPDVGAEVGDCFIIVRNKVNKEGGKMILGWQIWKTKHLIEAEAHAVWENSNDELVDLTPKQNGEIQILFVEDENLVYEDKQIDNIRLNITNNPLVEDLIDVGKAIHRFYNLGERADLYDLTDLLNDRQILHIEYLKEMQYFISALLKVNGKRKSPCPCNSGIPFKDCHGKDLEARISRVV